jgi:leader peptidase (prepilin peptidase) / N-methyltransferase
MYAFVVVMSTVLGLLVGSFLNVVIYRVPLKQSVVTPRSRCPGCETALAPRDNIPVVSWLMLRGRCRTCSMRISPRYPVVELLTAIAFGVMAAHFGTDWALPAFLVFTACLISVSAVDIERFIVPNRIIVATLAVGFPLLVVAAAAGDDWNQLVRGVLGGLAASGGLLVMNLINPRWMGMGDVKLCLVLGLFLGWLSWGHVGVGMFLGFLLGAVGGVILIATGLRTRKDHIPFAPFLAAGAYITVLSGSAFLDWYTV